MIDAIFKFKRYEDASLTYTGINKHTSDEVGGWDTTIRKSQYEKLFYNQQASMSEVDEGAYTQRSETATEPQVAVKAPAKPTVVQLKPVVAQPVKTTASEVVKPVHTDEAEDLKARSEKIEAGDIVYHKKFGKGEVVKINKNEKFIYVKFMLGEKKFMFPGAFLDGFLEME